MLNSAAMEDELLLLEQRVREVADLCAQLRRTNHELRQRIAALENDNRRLQGKIDTAALRIEQLISHTPE